jgi:hypothetical protein
VNPIFKLIFIASLTFLGGFALAEESAAQRTTYRTFEVNGFKFGGKILEEIRATGEIKYEEDGLVGPVLTLKNGDGLTFLGDVLESAIFINIQDPVELAEIAKNLEVRFKTKANVFSEKFTKGSYEISHSGKKIRLLDIGEVVISLRRTKRALNKDQCGRDVFDETGPNIAIMTAEVKRRCLGRPFELVGATIWVGHVQAGEDVKKRLNEIIRKEELLQRQSEQEKKQNAIERAKKF